MISQKCYEILRSTWFHTRNAATECIVDNYKGSNLSNKIGLSTVDSIHTETSSAIVRFITHFNLNFVESFT